MAWEPDYITDVEMRKYLRIPDTDDDAELAVAISASSGAVNLSTGRQFGKVDTAEERKYTAQWDRRRCRWVVVIDDLMTTTDLAVSCTGGTITDYTLEPVNAAAKGRPWEILVVNSTSSVMPTDLENDVEITGTWGWTAVPSPVKLATRLQASRFHARRDSPYGIAGSPDQGHELRLLARVDPDVAVMLRRYARKWAMR